MSHKEIHCQQSYFVCQFPDSGYFSTTWLLKQVKEISANKENFYWPNWVEAFLKWKAKATRSFNVKVNAGVRASRKY